MKGNQASNYKKISNLCWTSREKCIKIFRFILQPLSSFIYPSLISFTEQIQVRRTFIMVVAWRQTVLRDLLMTGLTPEKMNIRKWFPEILTTIHWQRRMRKRKVLTSHWMARKQTLKPGNQMKTQVQSCRVLYKQVCRCRKIRRVTKFAPIYRILVLINFFVGEEAHRVQRVKTKLGIWKTQATDLVSFVNCNENIM